MKNFKKYIIIIVAIILVSVVSYVAYGEISKVNEENEVRKSESNVRITDFYSSLSHNIWGSLPEDYVCYISAEVTGIKKNISSYSVLIDYYGENDTLEYSDSASLGKTGSFSSSFSSGSLVNLTKVKISVLNPKGETIHTQDFKINMAQLKTNDYSN